MIILQIDTSYSEMMKKEISNKNPLSILSMEIVGCERALVVTELNDVAKMIFGAKKPNRRNCILFLTPLISSENQFIFFKW